MIDPLWPKSPFIPPQNIPSSHSTPQEIQVEQIYSASKTEDQIARIENQIKSTLASVTNVPEGFEDRSLEEVAIEPEIPREVNPGPTPSISNTTVQSQPISNLTPAFSQTLLSQENNSRPRSALSNKSTSSSDPPSLADEILSTEEARQTALKSLNDLRRSLIDAVSNNAAENESMTNSSMGVSGPVE